MSDSAHSSNVLPIVRLVREHVGARDLRPFAKERGIAYSTLRYYNDEHLEPLRQMPRPQTLQQLASALRVSLERVQQAAVDSLAGRVDLTEQPSAPDSGEPPSVEDAIRADPHLIPEARRHLLAQYQLLLRIAGDEPTPIRPATRGEAVAIGKAMIETLDEEARKPTVTPVEPTVKPLTAPTPIRGKKPRRK